MHRFITFFCTFAKNYCIGIFMTTADFENKCVLKYKS